MHPKSLYFGDNLRWLRDRDHFPDASVDLVYLDPPFNSKRDYNMVFREAAGPGDTAQVQAFADTWSFDGAAEDFHYVTTHHDRLSRLLDALKLTYGGDRTMLSMTGYLAVMAARLIELHRVLKPTGSLYLHCDPTASHYLKVVLDAVFGPGRLVNEVVWKRSYGHGDSRRSMGRSHDTILFYAKSKDHVLNRFYHAHDPSYLATMYRYEDERGRYKHENLNSPNSRPNLRYEYKGYPPPALGWRVSRQVMEQLDAEGRLYFPPNPGGRIKRKVYLHEQGGQPMTDVWTDIRLLSAAEKERLGYPTQKPLPLLERIISASSNEGDLVLDPFCGCGTAVVAAQKLGRQWIGIDITALATSTIRKRLCESFPDAFASPAAIPVHGFPADLAGARQLADDDRHNFQNWVLSLIPTARPKGGTPRKGADQGIDGVWLWQDAQNVTQRGIISVKSGHVNAGQVRDLLGAMANEGAAMGLFVTLEAPTQPMHDAAAQAGFYELAGTPARFRRVQIVAADELLRGELPKLPLAFRIEAYKAAQPIDDGGQGMLDYGE